jgi:hypothetical protein
MCLMAWSLGSDLGAHVSAAAVTVYCLPPTQYRWNILRNIRNAIDQNEGGLENFSQGERGGGFRGGCMFFCVCVCGGGYFERVGGCDKR